MGRNYNHGTVPAFFTPGKSSLIRAEFEAIEDGMEGVEAEIDLKAAKGGDTYTGDHDFTGAVVEVAAPTESAHPVTKLYADGLAFYPVLPGQAGNAGLFVTTDGSVASWADPKSQGRSVRTSNVQIGHDDRELYVDITSGTFTQTFAACSTLGDNWMCILGNSGTGHITLCPDGAETIDGLTTFIMYPGELRLIFCTGSALVSRVLNPFTLTYTSSGTFVKPPGYARFEGIAWSGGSSGQRSGGSGRAVGGGGGGAFPFAFPSSVVAASEAVTVGAGGDAVTTAAAGNIGGATSFGAMVTVSGAATGQPTSGGAYLNLTTGTGPATTSGEFRSMTPYAGAFQSASGGSTWWGGAGSSSDATVNSGNSIYGGAAGGGIDGSGVIRTAGTSTHGGSGGAAGDAVNGTNGTAPGGGGGGTRTGTASGAGARGELRIWGIV